MIKVAIEVGIGICTKCTAEYTKRGDDFSSQLVRGEEQQRRQNARRRFACGMRARRRLVDGRSPPTLTSLLLARVLPSLASRTSCLPMSSWR